MTPLSQKCGEKQGNNTLPRHSRKIVDLLFCVFQTKLNKAVNIFCRLPEWIRNVQMIPGFSKDLNENLAWLTEKTKDPKSNKGNLTFSPHTVNTTKL